MASAPKRQRIHPPCSLDGTEHSSAKPKTMGPKSTPASSSPYMPMFEVFRAELDEHHDRRERVIKASRDITALSKKMIFSLQRAKSLPSPLPTPITSENSPRLTTITTLLTTLLTSDLTGPNAWRYQRQISPGIQEYVEAAVFQHYLETQTLLTVDDTRKKLPEDMLLTEEDWVLGVFDAIGEMMRWGVTGMAVSGGKIPGGRTGGEGGEEMDVDGVEGGKRDMLSDMRALRSSLEGLETRGAGVNGAVGKKMDVMKTCVEKIENAVYGMIVRGSERPKGWVPEGREGERTEVESY